MALLTPDDPQESPMHLDFWRVFDQCPTIPKGIVCSCSNFGRTDSCCGGGNTALVQSATVCPIVSAMSMRQMTECIRQLRQLSDSLEKVLANHLGILGVKGMLCIHQQSSASCSLDCCHGMQRQCGLATAFWAINLHWCVCCLFYCFSSMFLCHIPAPPCMTTMTNVYCAKRWYVQPL